ncbi:hypothetical protein Tco_0576763 [Tanacetum coccineum]
MESIRRNFFNGVQCDERKIVWIKRPRLYGWLINCKSRYLFLRRSVRGGVESSQLALLQTYIEGTLLSNMEDRWVWDLNGECVFRVKDVRILLDECFLPKAPTATRWFLILYVRFAPLLRKIPRYCSSVADWLTDIVSSYAAGESHHGAHLVHYADWLIVSNSKSD